MFQNGPSFYRTPLVCTVGLSALQAETAQCVRYRSDDAMLTCFWLAASASELLRHLSRLPVAYLVRLRLDGRSSRSPRAARLLRFEERSRECERSSRPPPPSSVGDLAVPVPSATTARPSPHSRLNLRWEIRRPLRRRRRSRHSFIDLAIDSLLVTPS